MEEVSKIFDLNPTLFSEKIERVWTCKDGPARAYFEWTSSTLAPGFQVGRTRPETQSDRSGLVWKLYARFGFAPKDAEILPEET